MQTIRTRINKWKEQRVNTELSKYPMAIQVTDKYIVLAPHKMRITP